MNWHETILYIRNQPEFSDLVDQAYFDARLELNVERFKEREEFKAALKLLHEFGGTGGKLLDVGSGNGISSLAFALNGFNVTVVEPDPSDTIGANAIRVLADEYGQSISVEECYAEKMPFESETFDIVYVRQAMHHAANLDAFVSECSRVLKKGGIFITVRDHVIYNEKDKEWFLQSHPLHKFYGGENAFTADQYKNAMKKAGLDILKELKHFDSVINYFPMTEYDFKNKPLEAEKKHLERLRAKIGFLASVSFIQKWYLKRYHFDRNKFWNEEKVAGRLYTYLCRKK